MPYVDFLFEYDNILLMKKIFYFLLLFGLFPSYSILAAPAPQDDRRIEEQKRNDLKPTEVHYQGKKPVAKGAPLLPDDTVYLFEMALRKVTYGYDLCKTIVILKGVENDYIGLDSQVRYLKEQNYLPKHLEDTFDPMKPLRRGVTAFVLLRVLDIKGGIFLRVFNESERYALKELLYEGIMSSGNVNEIIGGDELASAITRAVNYLRGREDFPTPHPERTLSDSEE